MSARSKLGSVRGIALVATLLLLAILVPGSARAGLQDLLREEYDMEADVGRLLAPGPDRQPVVLAERPDQLVTHYQDFEIEGRPAVLVLWRAFYSGYYYQPQIWSLDAQGRLGLRWPADPNLAWANPEVELEEVDDELLLVVTRELPPTDADQPTVKTREHLRVGPSGVQVVRKRYSKWEGEAQLVRVMLDQLTIGRADKVLPLMERYMTLHGVPSATTQGQVAALLRDHAAGLRNQLLRATAEKNAQEEEKTPSLVTENARID